MIEKIIKLIVVAVVLVLAYWAFSLIVTAIASTVGFAYTSVVLAIIAGLLLIGFCVFALRLFGIVV